MKKVTKFNKSKLGLEIRFILNSDTHATFTFPIKEEKFFILELQTVVILFNLCTMEVSFMLSDPPDIIRQFNS